jgi:transposase
MLSLQSEQLKTHIFKKQSLYGGNKVVFFDVTTLYFESQQEDELKAFGYSKDCKFNEVQIVLSLVINSEGRPLAYEIFEGATFEGSTLLPVLQRFKAQFGVDKVIIVADRGIGSRSNLTGLKEAGFDYIVGARLRSASKEIQAKAIDRDGLNSLYHNNEDAHSYKFIDNADQSWVIMHSSKRALKDQADRQRLVEKAASMVASSAIKAKRGANKYIKQSATKAEIDWDKIHRDALYDGYYALTVSDKSMSAQDIAAAYHQLWMIEESFRTMKSFFEIRPMFHWTPQRIKGHVMLNFISLVLENNLLLALKERIGHISHELIRDAIDNMEQSILQINDARFITYSTLTTLQKDILEILHIDTPQNHKI